MNRIIITGGPGSGKTSLLKALRNKGMQCFDEIARAVIEEQQAKKGQKTPWQDVTGFTELVYENTLAKFDEPISNFAFVDRGLPDNIAYLKHYGGLISTQWKTFNYFDFYYPTVFLLPAWEAIYEQDPQRLQSYTEAQALHKELVKTYRDLGFEIIQLQKTTVSKRVTAVIQYTNHLH